MSETTEKNQIGDKIDTEQPDDNTWNLIIKHARDELSKCLDELPKGLHDPDEMLKSLNRLQSLVCTLDKLADVYRELLKLRQVVQKK